MKIAIVSSYAFPSSKATGNRVQTFYDALSHTDASSITVISASPDGTSGNLPVKITSSKKQLYLVPVLQTNFDRRKLFLRSFHEAKQTFKIWRQIKQGSFDFCIITIPSVQLLLLGSVLPKYKFSLDIRDAVWEYLSNGSTAQRAAAKFIKQVLKISVKRAAFVTATNEAEAQSILSITESECLIISNGISEYKFQALSEITAHSKSKECKKILKTS